MKIKTWNGRRVLALGLVTGLVLVVGCKKKQMGRENEAPTIDSLEIRPQAPTAGQDLNASVQYHDPEGDPVMLDYRWSVNGQVKQEGSGLSTLPGAWVKSGAKVALEARARDGGHTGGWVAASPVQVREEVVKLKGVSLEPAKAYRNATLAAKVDAGDAAAESLTLFYRWRVNGELVADASEPTLANAFGHGDSVVVEVSPNEDFPTDQTWRSTPLRILDAPPEFKSEPNFTWEGGKFVYQMEATDPDDDSLTYFLEKGPAGMTLDPKTGLASWKPGPNQTGVFEVRLGVDDGRGGKVGQQTELNVSGPQPPAP
jgi:hypothetical protein